MFFRAQNLGPLRDAEVDLSKDLIVLAGPNNSGKTYMAWSIYGLHRSPAMLREIGKRWAQTLLDAPDLTIDLNDFLKRDGATLAEYLASQYQANLHLCFSADSDRFNSTRVSIRDSDWRVKPAGPRGFIFNHEPVGTLVLDRFAQNLTQVRVVILGEKGKDLLQKYFSNALDRSATDTLVQRNLLQNLPSEKRQALEDYLALHLLRFIDSPVLHPCTLFPAERIAVNIFARELALKRADLIDEMVDAELDGHFDAPADLIRNNVGRYPWPIRDSLRVANDLENLSKRKGALADLANELEISVLGGAIAVSGTGELLFAPGSSTGLQLQMHLTAAVVKSLSSLVFYFRHLAQKGDFIIIDEPELNLHPDNQRKVTRILAKAARLGFKVMISTHSDYVLRELNHMIMLSKLPEDVAKELGYDPLSSLTPEQVGVYLFNDHTATQVPIGETGFSIKTIDDVVNQLNADEQRLYARLEGDR